ASSKTATCVIRRHVERFMSTGGLPKRRACSMYPPGPISSSAHHDARHPGETEIRPSRHQAPRPEKKSKLAPPPAHSRKHLEKRPGARRNRGDRRKDRLNPRDSQRVAGRRIELRARHENRLESNRALEGVVEPSLIELGSGSAVDEAHRNPAGDRARRPR